MADTIKILGQSNPAATTSTDIYTVPSSTSTTVSSITVCNRSTTGTTFRISVAIAGAGLSNEQYLYYDVPIQGNETFVATVGITLATTDKIRVYATNNTLSFNVFGVEVT
jgi:hypothetical protein